MGKILVTHYKVRINDPENAPEKPFSVAVLSDMHNEVYRSGVAQLMEAIRNEQVSAVFSVGDLLVAKGERCACDVALDVLGRLTELYPVYAVNGNHEVRMRNVPQFREQFLEYDRRVRALGVTMIDNLRVPLRIGGSRIGLYGLEIDNGYYRKNLREGECEQPSKGRKPARKHFLTVQDMEKLVGKPQPGERQRVRQLQKISPGKGMPAERTSR